MPSEQRLHPLSILFSLGKVARDLALPGIVVLVGAGRWDWERWLPLLVIPYALVAIGRYVSFRYRYEENEMVIRTGLVFRNERHIPYSRIQNLDAVQNVLHRLFGVIEVRVETGGGQEPEARMSVVPVAAFEEMRRRVSAGKAGVAVVDPEAAGLEGAEPAVVLPSVPEHTLLRLPLREVVLCGLLQNRGVVFLGAAFGLLWELRIMDRFLGRTVGEELSGRDAARGLVKSVFQEVGLPDAGIGFTLAALAAFLLILRVLSVAWALLRLHGFHLTRTGEDLRTEFGLLTRVVSTIPLRRVQTLTIQEGLLYRLFGRAAVRVDTAGAGAGAADTGENDKAKQREWLAPIIRRDELPALLHEMLPGLDLAAVSWNPAPPRAFRRELKPSLFFALLATVPCAVLLKGWAVVPFALFVAIAVVAAHLTVKHLGWAVTDNAVLFRTGWLKRQVSVAPFGKIQAVSLHESPFDRRAAMASLRVDTAGAGDASHRVDIPYLPRETARQLCDLLAVQAAGTAFRW